ncbi:PAS domain-containing protein [Paraburkholderia caribensis]|nr:PAS domain-containing protein [Paraburkholderia caribensis]
MFVKGAMGSDASCTSSPLSSKYLVEGIPLPVVLLDKQLRLRHFSPQAQQLFGFPHDSVGHPMEQLSQMFSTGDLERMVLSAVQGLTEVEHEYQDADGHWWLVNVRAYRTTDTFQLMPTTAGLSAGLQTTSNRSLEPASL